MCNKKDAETVSGRIPTIACFANNVLTAINDSALFIQKMI